MMRRRSHYRTSRLLLRDFLSHSGTWLAFAATVAAIAMAVTAFPLAFEAMGRAEASHALEVLPDADRMVIATADGGPQKTAGLHNFTLFHNDLDSLAKRSGAELAAALGPAAFVSTSDRIPAGGTVDKEGDQSVFIRLLVAPAFPEESTVVDGALPAPFTSTPGPLDIALSEASAEAVGWPVGETRVVGSDTPLELRLASVLAPRATASGFWALAPTALRPERAESFFQGSRSRIVTVDAFIDPESFWTLKLDYPLTMSTTVGFSIDIADLPTSGLASLEQQLIRFTTLTHTVGSRIAADVAWEFQFSSGSADAIHNALERIRTTATATAVVVSGPLGVALAVLWLLAGLLVERRRTSLALLLARGAGGAPLRVALGVEALAVGLVAAAAGGWLAFAFVRSSNDGAPVLFWPPPAPPALLPAGLIAFVSAALLVLAVRPKLLTRDRRDLTGRRHGTLRLAAEAGVILVTAVAVALLLGRGLATTDIGFDPLLAAAPLLVSLTAALIVLRLYPVPLLAVLRGARGRRGVVAFLGSARAIRNPAAGLAAVLAVIVGLGVSLFSVVLLDTVRAGIDDASRSVVGADLRAAGGPISPESFTELAELPGVGAVVGVYRYNGQKRVTEDGREVGVTVLVADLEALAKMQATVPGAPAPDGDPTALRDGAIPVVFSAALSSAHPAPLGLTFSGSGLVAVGTPGSLPAFGVGSDWLLVDSSFAEVLGVVNERPTLALFDLEPGADVTSTADAVGDILGEAFAVLDPATAAEQHRAAPVVAWLQLLLVAISIALALACAGACVLSLVVAAPATARLVALLRTLGLSAAQSRGITAWEIVPVAIVGAVAGCAAAALLSLLVLPGLDLRPYTGGTTGPAPSADLAVLGAVAAGFLVVVMLLTTIVMVTTRRLRIAAALRSTMEG